MNVTHHISDAVMAAYATGSLSQAFSLVVATHVSMCDDCRAALEAHEAAGGVVLDGIGETALTGNLRARVMAALDDPAERFDMEAPAIDAFDVYPAPVAQALRGQGPKWKRLGGGVRQCILSADNEGSARLLYIPAGRPVPEHTHGGLELTLVLQGGFSDATGHFGVGDVEQADGDLEHIPTADEGVDCICLAATDAPLRFHGLVPRILQPFFAI
ncbi:ChrR family anti-sigma-E factor [Maritimibacter sp. DP1N21-5]|nr:ChrR family anti-sigma-E factor [Maritimibacter sp. DP1N21-5]